MSDKSKPPAKRKVSEAAYKKWMWLTEETETPAKETAVDRSEGEGRIATARWGMPSIDPALEYTPGKIWLGHDPGTDRPAGFGDDRHIFMVAGSRCGKGTSFIVNNLIAWPGSVVCIDPKGENATVTARRRGEGSAYSIGIGQKVCVLDPMNATHGIDDLKAGYNPLDEIDPNDPDAIDEVLRMADAIVITGQSKDNFFDESAREMVKGLILHVLTDDLFNGRRNLVTVRRLLTHGDQETVALARDGYLEDEPDISEEDLAEKLPSPFAMLFEGMKHNDAFDGVVSGVGESFSSMIETAEKTYEGVLQTARRNTEFMDSPGMRACLENSSLRLSELKTDPAGVSLYLSLPQRYMNTHFRWLRMMVALTISQMEKTPGQPATGHQTLMVLDEFAGLKRMEEVENAAAQIAGAGVKLLPVVQNIGQLKKIYEKNWESFLSNAGTKIFFGVEDAETRKFVSEYIGETEVVRTVKTEGQSMGQTEQRGFSRSEAHGTNQSETHGTAESETWGTTEGVTTTQGQSNTTGSNSATNWSNGSGTNSSHGRSYQPGLFGPKNVTINASSGGSSNWSNGGSEGFSNSTTNSQSTAQSQSSTRGGSRTTNESQTTGSSQTLTEGESESTSRSMTFNAGVNESIHKTALISADEIGLRFARIDDPADLDFPGLALVMIAGRRPYVIRRANYHETPEFAGFFDPHPDHKLPMTLDELKLITNDHQTK